MRRYRLLMPALVLVVAGLVGCGSNPPADTGGDTKKKPRVESKPVPNEKRGDVTGKVTLKGGPPVNLDEETMKLQADMAKSNKDLCLAADAKPEEKQQFTWRIGKDNGLKNVIVWVEPQDGYYFKMDKIDLDPKTSGWEEKVVMDQPHCAYDPHVFVLFPSHRDGDTKQVFTIKNSSTTAHNVKWEGDQADNIQLAPDQETKHKKLDPSVAPINFQCNVHGWMKGYARVFDHPYAAVTDADGNFTLKNVPAGSKLKLMYWHESMKAPQSMEIEVKEGKNPQDIDFTAPK